jgi:multidrug efflux pump subunit AcrA (membrane-fusion protein)
MVRSEQNINVRSSADSEINISGTSGRAVFVGAQSKRARNLKRLSAVILAAVCTLWGYDYLKGFVVADSFFERSKVRTALVQRGDYERSMSVEGNVVASFRPRLYAQNTGVVYLNVKEGDIVRKDQ